MLWERFLGFLGWEDEGTHGRQGWPRSGQHPGLLTHQGRAQGPALRVSVCPLSLCFGLPSFCASSLKRHRWGLSHSLCFPAAAALSPMYQGLLLMTFLSVFQIVSNKSIPRKRPREVAFSTFQTCGFPVPFPSSLVPPAFLVSCDASFGICNGMRVLLWNPGCVPFSES